MSRVILAARCEAFRGLFLSQMKESQVSVIPLPDIDPESFLFILHYIYTGNLLVNGYND
jgi:hypothetical protein